VIRASAVPVGANGGNLSVAWEMRLCRGASTIAIRSMVVTFSNGLVNGEPDRLDA